MVQELSKRRMGKTRVRCTELFRAPFKKRIKNISDQMINKFIPLAKPCIDEEEIDSVVETIKSGWLTLGPKTKQFEDEFARYIGCKNAIAVNSCTAALHLSLVALDIGPDDEVITSPLTFCSTINVIVHTGAKPVLVDIDKETYNIDPNLIEEKITSKTKAIIPVHYAGQPCEMDGIMKLAKKHGLAVIEDAAHAVGSEYKEKKIGTIGNTTCFSFYATKNLTTGEGGMITTDNDELADKLRILRLHGMNKDAWKRYTQQGSWYYEVQCAGWKYNMTDIQAAIGLVQLKKLDRMNEKRRQLAHYYNKQLVGVDGLTTPKEAPNIKHVYHLYPLLVEPSEYGMDRNALTKYLAANNIGTSVHFIPTYLYSFYRKNFGFKKSDFPNTEQVYEREVSLPLYPTLAYTEIDYITRKIKKDLNGKDINNRKKH